MGKFVDIIIDDHMPGRRANPCDTEWWVPLCEKAYAKFWGGYKNIEGNNPCWALTDLTGGISIKADNSKGMNRDTLFQLKLKNSCP